jgi:predicted component of type VI protein secretion system
MINPRNSNQYQMRLDFSPTDFADATELLSKILELRLKDDELRAGRLQRENRTFKIEVTSMTAEDLFLELLKREAKRLSPVECDARIKSN